MASKLFFRNRKLIGRSFAVTALASTVAFVASAQTTGGGSIRTVDGQNLALQKVPTVFKFQAHLSQAKMPLADAVFDNIFVNLRSGDNTLCTEQIPNVRVRESVLNLEIGRGMSCPLDDYIATKNDLNLQVCIKSADNCLKPIALSSVPYAVKSTYAQTAQRAQVTDRATLADYSQRVSADRDALQPGVIGRGYFEFQTPPDLAPLFNGEAAPAGVDRANAGYLLWTPVNQGAKSLSLAFKGIDTDQAGRLNELVFHSDITSSRGNARVSGWQVVGGGEIDGTSKLTVNGDENIHGNSTIGGNELVIGNGTINGNAIVLLNASIGGNEDVGGRLNVGQNAIITTSAAVGTTLTTGGAATIGGLLTANQSAVITGTAAISSSLTCGGAATVSGLLTVNNAANVTGATTIGGALTVNNSASVTGTATAGNLVATRGFTDNGTAQFNGNATFGASGTTAQMVVWDAVQFKGPVSGLPTSDPNGLPDGTIRGEKLAPGTVPWDRINAATATTSIEAIVTAKMAAYEKRIAETEIRTDLLTAAALLTNDPSFVSPNWYQGVTPPVSATDTSVVVQIIDNAAVARDAAAVDTLPTASNRALCRRGSKTLLLSAPVSMNTYPQGCASLNAVPAIPTSTEWTAVRDLVAPTGVGKIWIWLRRPANATAFQPAKSWQETLYLAN
jgi:hypothetical protein